MISIPFGMEDGLAAFAGFVGQDVPETGFDLRKWQDAVDAAEILRLQEKGRDIGLILRDGRTHKARCAFLLRRGRQLGIVPTILRCRQLPLFPLSEKSVSELVPSPTL